MIKAINLENVGFLYVGVFLSMLIIAAPAQSQTLQKEERLWGMPVTNYEQILQAQKNIKNSPPKMEERLWGMPVTNYEQILRAQKNIKNSPPKVEERLWGMPVINLKETLEAQIRFKN